MTKRSVGTWILLTLTAGLLGCPTPDPEPTDGGVPGTDGSVPGVDGSVPGTDGSVPDGGTTTGAFRCTTGSLFSGFPEHDSEVGIHANEGDPLAGVEGRPLGWRSVVFVDDHIVTIVGQEIWSSDLSASSPTVHRLAGSTSSGQSLLDGPCATARFANLHDIVATSDGDLYVIDQTANTVLSITDPFGPACAVSYVAGTSTDTLDITPVTPPNVGETEGPGATAQFALPGRMAIDGAGNLYVWDTGNSSIRRVANDAAHTVSTLAPVVSGEQEVIVDGLAVIGSSLFALQHDTGNEVFLESIDTSTGAKTEIFRGRATVFGFGSSDALQTGGLTTDGIDLFLYFKGGIFSVTTAGVITRIAGDEDARSTIEFETGYDPMATHPALDVHLANRSQYATAGADSWLAIDDAGDLYFVGSVLDPYVERLDCGR